MDLRRLREETRAEHEATEATLPLTEPGLNLAAYVAALGALLPIIEGWEHWAAEHGPVGVRALLEARRRGFLLRRDLAHFGVTEPGPGVDRTAVDWNAVIADGRGIDSLPVEEFEATFFGAFYVMEGSTLGGRFIARSVEAAFGLTPGEGDAYFQGHGERTGVLWRETMAAITAVPEEWSEVVIAAAKRTFGAFGEALEAQRSARTGVAVR